ncbi:apolipoprotein N-acyltransferase [Aeromicrobium sp. CF4.19]|uniref:apolipoprotein N-acyltransferase n=1 Tax=Aeromicrobium sp. CF4.19 TaxID=3373082 RepID=UPI003EE7ED1D
MRARWALPLTVLAGLLSAAAFDPFTVPYAMVLGVAVLVVVLRRLDQARVRLVLAVGATYGLSFMAVLIWWMNAVSNGAYVALVLAQVGVFAIIAIPLRSALRLRWWPLWGAAVWVAGEWFRSSFPLTGFPWGRLGHTAIDTPFEAWVRIGGMPWLSAVMFVVAASLVVLCGGAVLHRALAAGAILTTMLVGAVLPTGVTGQDGTADVALVQGDVPGAILSWPRGEIFALHLAETRRLTRDVEDGTVPRPDVVMWPETTVDVDPFTNETVQAQIEATSARIGAPILIGALLDGPTSDTAYNASVVWDEDGPGSRYVKRKLVPYGEYVPFRQLLGDIVPRVDRDIPRDMLPGEDSAPLRVGGLVVGGSICWDLAYDGIIRDAAGEDVQVLSGQTSNAAFTGTAQPEQQWKISRLRALETGRWMLVPSTNGISGVADAHGDVVERAPMHEPATISVEVPLASGRTPALVVGPYLQWTLVGLGLVGWILGWRTGRGRGRA